MLARVQCTRRRWRLVLCRVSGSAVLHLWLRCRCEHWAGIASYNCCILVALHCTLMCMRSMRVRSWILLVVLGLVVPAVAWATTVVPVTVEELARRADEVVIATPRASRSQWIGGLIFTDVDVEVHATLRGALAPGSRVMLRIPGGVVGQIGQQVPGVPELDPGQPYVMFLSRAPDRVGMYYLAHLTAAVMRLANTSGGTVTVAFPGEGMVVRSTGDTSVSSVPRGGIALGQLVQRLRSVR